MKLGHEYLERRLNFDDFVDKNMKITKEIVNADLYVSYGINVRKQLGMDVSRAKAGVDLQKLVPKDVKCVFFDRCEGEEMPKLPDGVEVLYIRKCNFKKIYFPKGLKEMYFDFSPSIKTLPDLSNLKHLWSLDIHSLVELRFLPKNLPESLILLTIKGNNNLKSSLNSLPKNLEFIYIGECYNILSIPSLSYLKNLKFFTAEYLEQKVDLKVSKSLLSRKDTVVDIELKNRVKFT